MNTGKIEAGQTFILVCGDRPRQQGKPYTRSWRNIEGSRKGDREQYMSNIRDGRLRPRKRIFSDSVQYTRSKQQVSGDFRKRHEGVLVVRAMEPGLRRTARALKNVSDPPHV